MCIKNMHDFGASCACFSCLQLWLLFVFVRESRCRSSRFNGGRFSELMNDASGALAQIARPKLIRLLTLFGWRPSLFLCPFWKPGLLDHPTGQESFKRPDTQLAQTPQKEFLLHTHVLCMKIELLFNRILWIHTLGFRCHITKTCRYLSKPWFTSLPKERARLKTNHLDTQPAKYCNTGNTRFAVCCWGLGGHRSARQKETMFAFAASCSKRGQTKTKTLQALKHKQTGVLPMLFKGGIWLFWN